MTQAHAKLDPIDNNDDLKPHQNSRGETLKVLHYIELEANQPEGKPHTQSNSHSGNQTTGMAHTYGKKGPSKTNKIQAANMQAGNMQNSEKTDTQAAKFWSKISAKYAKSKVRDEDAYAYTLDRTIAYLKQSDHMLELGCGTGTTALKLAEHVRHLTATDFSQGMIDIANQKQAELGVPNLDFMQKSVEDLPFYETYDVIFASSLLHLVDDLETALARIYSSVEPGGLFISKTVCLKGENPLFRILIPILQMIGKAPQVSYITGDELEKAMVRAGFEIIESEDHNHKPACRFIVAKRT